MRTPPVCEATQILGMNSVMGDESLRRALAQIAPAPKASHSDSQQKLQQEQLHIAEQWMNQSLLDSVQHALGPPLDSGH